MLSPEIEERAADARMIQNSKVFKEAMENLMAEYTRKLVQADVGSLTATTAHASMKVLADVQGQLKSFIDEATMQRARR
jgi:hypothetical protein